MRGSLVQRYKGSWSIVLDLGYQTDPTTGKTRRKQKWVTVRGTKREADARLAELVRDAHRGEFVQPHKRTLGEWLDEWVDKAIKPPARTLRAYETYKSVITTHLKPKLGALPLQQVKATDLKRYYDEAAAPVPPESGRKGRKRRALAPATLEQHHTILHSALQAAVLEGLVQRNVAKLVVGKPHTPDVHKDALEHCGEAHEAKAFLSAAKEAGPQPAAFYGLDLDTGMRKAELCGLRWSDVDLAGCRVTIQRQLVKTGSSPVFGPVKNKAPSTVEVATETAALLRRHRTHQAELRLANGEHYHDHGLVFAKEWEDLTRHRDTLGEPLQMNNLGQREFAKLIKAAGVRRIKFHGLRHTCATLLLQAGVPANVVQRRLGHKKIEITLSVYAHALPAMQQDAAARLAAILH
jgi:integrase